MNVIHLLRVIGAIPPEAWDAIIPHGPVYRSRADLASLNPQPLPPRDHFAVNAATMAHELVRMAVESEVQGKSSAAFVTEFVDDWCGTSWPRKWPWPGPGPRHGGGPHPDPWEVSVGRVIGATVFASASGRLGETELAKTLQAGAEKLADAAVRGAEKPLAR
jgi:hypothetical protein